MCLFAGGGGWGLSWDNRYLRCFLLRLPLFADPGRFQTSSTGYPVLHFMPCFRSRPWGGNRWIPAGFRTSRSAPAFSSDRAGRGRWDMPRLPGQARRCLHKAGRFQKSSAGYPVFAFRSRFRPRSPGGTRRVCSGCRGQPASIFGFPDRFQKSST